MSLQNIKPKVAGHIVSVRKWATWPFHDPIFSKVFLKNCSISEGCFQENSLYSHLIHFLQFLEIDFYVTWFKIKKIHLVSACMFHFELSELNCLFELNSQGHLSCNPMFYLVLCGLLLHRLIFQENVFLTLQQFFFSFLYEENLVVTLICRLSFNTLRSFPFFKEFIAVG